MVSVTGAGFTAREPRPHKWITSLSLIVEAIPTTVQTSSPAALHATHREERPSSTTKQHKESKHAPSPYSEIPSTSPNQQGLSENSSDYPTSGRIEPRLVTPVNAGESYGPSLTLWAKRVLNLDLMEWQKRVVNDALSLDDDGDFVFREACISTARQNGKSLVMRAVAGFMATEYAATRKEAQTIVIVANQKRRSMALFRDLVRDLEDKFLCKVRWQNGDERINFPDGSSIAVVAASAHAHGMTASVLLVDEIWDISPEVVFTALRPSQIAVKNPMMMMFQRQATKAQQCSSSFESRAWQRLTQAEQVRCTSQSGHCHPESVWKIVAIGAGRTLRSGQRSR
jgi:hypothetical protein